MLRKAFEMATRKTKSKFDLDQMVEDAQKRVQEFIDTEFDKLQVETKASFKEARKNLKVKGK
jgi:methionine synthase I (cobalamin-dependent)